MRSGSSCKAHQEGLTQVSLIASRSCHRGSGHQYTPVSRKSHHGALLIAFWMEQEWRDEVHSWKHKCGSEEGIRQTREKNSKMEERYYIPSPYLLQPTRACLFWKLPQKSLKNGISGPWIVSFQYLSPFSSLLTEKHCKLPDPEHIHSHTLQNTVKIDDNGEEREREPCKGKTKWNRE